MGLSDSRRKLLVRLLDIFLLAGRIGFQQLLYYDLGLVYAGDCGYNYLIVSHGLVWPANSYR